MEVAARLTSSEYAQNEACALQEQQVSAGCCATVSVSWSLLTHDSLLLRRAHQAEVARRCLEARLGAHAVELAERDTQVAYLSSAVGLAEDLLTAKQRWASLTLLTPCDTRHQTISCTSVLRCMHAGALRVSSISRTAAV